MKSRAVRKPPIAHSHSVQPSTGMHVNIPVSSAMSEYSPIVYSTDHNHPLASEDQKRHFFPASYDTQFLSDSSFTSSLTATFMDQQYQTFYRQHTDPNGPDPLPMHIVSKLKERFEKRVLHHHHPHHSHQSDNRRCQSDLKFQDNWSGSASSFLHSKPDKYQLVAAFLVNKGAVEAWHIYAPLPVDVGQSSEDCTGTRMLELTQRRLRLIQRYYSGARQYVVLYVNSNFAEHYLPMGLAREAGSAESFTKKTNKSRKSSNPDVFHTGHRIVSRILSSVRRTQRRSRSVNEVTENMKEKQQQQQEQAQSPHSETTDNSPSELIVSDPVNSCLRRNQSLPPFSRSDDLSANDDPKTSSPQSSFPSRSVSQTHGNSFIRRVFEHIWSSYSRPNHSKSVNFAKQLNGASSSQTATDNFQSSDDMPLAEGKSSTPKGRIDSHENESSSSGLIDFSSSTGSTTSDHLASSQPDILIVPSNGESRRKANGFDSFAKERKLEQQQQQQRQQQQQQRQRQHQEQQQQQQQQQQIWLPKSIQSR